MKKILIFGLPRTGTTLLQKHLGQSFGIHGYSEPFSDYKVRELIGDPYTWVSTLDHGIIKVLSVNLVYVDVNKLISVGNFDSVIVTRRQNLADSCVSLYYAEQIAKKYHYDKKLNPDSITKFVCPQEFIDEWILSSSWYNSALKKISDYIVFDYDQYVGGATQIINGVEFCLANEDKYKLSSVSNSLPYDQLCLNYNEIKKIINESRD